jgi:hypothetical protein
VKSLVPASQPRIAIGPIGAARAAFLSLLRLGSPGPRVVPGAARRTPGLTTTSRGPAEKPQSAASNVSLVFNIRISTEDEINGTVKCRI